MTILEIVSSDGASYIRFFRSSSIMERRPLAPVCLSIAFLAISKSAFSSNSRLTASMANSLVYCLISESFGSLRIRTSAFSSRPLSAVTTGSRPTSSGIRPNLTRSCGITSCIQLVVSSSTLDLISALNPRDDEPRRFSTVFSRPSNAPPQINRIFVVSICIKSC